MNWIERKIYLYNVTFGLYMLDWWERYLFNLLIIVLLWFICYNGSRSMADLYQSLYVLHNLLWNCILFWRSILSLDFKD